MFSEARARGAEFEDRTRFTRPRPGRCPACKASRIAYPRFSIGLGPAR